MGLMNFASNSSPNDKPSFFENRSDSALGLCGLGGVTLMLKFHSDLETPGKRPEYLPER